MRWNVASYPLVVFLVLLAFASPSFGQKIPTEQFSTNRFTPAPGPGNFLMVDGAVVGGHLTPSVGLFIDYAHRPFVLYDASCPGGDCEVDDADVEIVSYLLTGNAMGTLSLFQRLQLGVLVPVIATAGDSFAATTPNRPEPYLDIRGGKAVGLGDPRLSAKVRLLGEGLQGFSLALVGFATAPLGDATASGRHLGDDGLTGGGHLAAEVRAGRVRVALNAGGVYRPKRELLSTQVGPEFSYGVAGSFELTPLLAVLGEVTGNSQFTSELDENPVEFRAAGRLTQGDLVIVLGGGAGILSGVGVPNFRVVGGISYQPVGLDTDSDGVDDEHDKCPAEMEDLDGYLDEDGCPDDDNDADGLPDITDRCPDMPEDRDGFEDDDGCPDVDNDGDGIEDGYDSCPNEPEDKDGDRDDDGCPDNDRDRDGVPDDVDQCPDQPEDTDGFGDEDGCPETDFDGDGIPDDEDQCPDQPESFNGVEDDDGCPEEVGNAPDVTPP